MRIIGAIGKSGLGYVSARLISPRYGINASIRFYVDTGASHTAIADRDAERIGINYGRLRIAPYKVSGVGGIVDGYLLHECMLVFQFSQCAHIEYLNNILVLKHNPQTEEEKRKVQSIPSLLGVDVLKSYTVRFANKTIILEK